MNHKLLVLLLIFLSIVSCKNKNNQITSNQSEKLNEVKFNQTIKEDSVINLGRVDNQNPVKIEEPSAFINDKIKQERSRGATDITDKPNGQIIFSLIDNVPLNSTQIDNKGWAMISIEAEIPVDMDLLKQSKPIIKANTVLKVQNSEVGLVEQNLIANKVYMLNDKMYCILLGYIDAWNNIKSLSIIENQIKQLLGVNPLRAHAFLQPLINDFMETNPDTITFKPYIAYYCLENTIESTKPKYRIALLFNQGNLEAVLHARPITIPNTKEIKLPNELTVNFYTDANPEKQKKCLEKLNKLK